MLRFNNKTQELKESMKRIFLATILILTLGYQVYGKTDSISINDIELFSEWCLKEFDKEYCADYTSYLEQIGMTSDECDDDLSISYLRSCANIAAAYYMIANYEEAIKYYSRLDSNKLDLENLYHLGVSHSLIGLYEKAYDIFNRACETKEIIPDYYVGYDQEIMNRFLANAILLFKSCFNV